MLANWTDCSICWIGGGALSDTVAASIAEDTTNLGRGTKQENRNAAGNGKTYRKRSDEAVGLDDCAGILSAALSALVRHGVKIKIANKQDSGGIVLLVDGARYCHVHRAISFGDCELCVSECLDTKGGVNVSEG